MGAAVANVYQRGNKSTAFGGKFGVRIISVHSHHGLILHIKHCLQGSDTSVHTDRVQAPRSREPVRQLDLAETFYSVRVSAQHRHLLESSCPCCLNKFKVGHIVHSAKVCLHHFCLTCAAKLARDHILCFDVMETLLQCTEETTQTQRYPLCRSSLDQIVNATVCHRTLFFKS